MTDDNKEYMIQRLNSALETSQRTIQMLEKKLDSAKALISIFEREKKQWKEQQVIQDRIIKQQLEFADTEKEKLQEEIMELRAKLKEAA